MEQAINLFLVAGSKGLLEQTAQSSKVGIDLQKLAPGLLVFPALDPRPQTDTPDEFRQAQAGAFG